MALPRNFPGFEGEEALNQTAVMESRMAALEAKIERLVADEQNASDSLEDHGRRLEVLESKAKKRGSRIGAWQPSGDDRLYAKKYGFTHDEIERESENFVEYWSNVPGQKGIMLDWSKTWKRRIRDQAAYLGKTPPTKAQDASGAQEASTEGHNTDPAVLKLRNLLPSAEAAVAIRAAFCARRDLDLYILAACSDSVPEMKRFVPWWGSQNDDDVLMRQRGERNRLDRISQDLGYGPIQWPRSQ